MDAMFTVCIAKHDLIRNSKFKIQEQEVSILLNQKCMVQMR